VSIRKDEATGKRWIEVETEIPGSPEEVWQAIATGEGISSWFVPTEMEGRKGGAMTMHFGPGMDSTASVTAWEPPHRFAATSDGMGPGAPPMATEWTVEGKTGGTCVVRVVHSLSASTDDWDDHLTGVESGWPSFFRILRLYLTRFRGQASASFNVMTTVPGPEAAAWEQLQGSLGLAGSAKGDRCSAPDGAPPLSGQVEWVGKPNAELLILDKPAPGIVMASTCSMGDQAMLFMSFYLYGGGAVEAKSRVEAEWSEWMQQRFAAG